MLDISVINQGPVINAASPTVIKIIGCGGGGSNAVNQLIEQGISNVEFVVLNTDLQALNASKAQNRLAIGQKLTGGLGAGGNPEIGENAAKEDTEVIKNIVKGTDMVIITAGMGGGTGTGSAPIVAQVAREEGALTIAVVTTPFEFEGEVRMQNAENGLKKLREQVDSLIVVPNQQVMKFSKEKLSFLDAFRMADSVLCQGVQGISEIITVHGQVNIDFADVKTVMKGQGEALLGVGIGEGENRAVDAAQNAISNPMLENRSIDGAKNILVNITGPEDLAMEEVEEIVKNVSASAAKGRSVFWGQAINPDMGDRISVTVIATGFDTVQEVSASESFKKIAQEESSDVTDYGDFEKILHGGISRTSEEKASEFSMQDSSAVRGTNSSNPGLFDEMINKGTDIPHENAEVSSNGKQAGVIASSQSRPSWLKDIEVPAGFENRMDDINVPTVYREKLKGLSHSIKLSDD